MPVTDFLNITDGYPIEVEVKGAFVPWSAHTIYFTSNFDWTAWWSNLGYDQTQAVSTQAPRTTSPGQPDDCHGPTSVVSATEIQNDTWNAVFKLLPSLLSESRIPEN